MASGSPSRNGGEQWATRIGVILAVAGSAVGLGNFLRFPGLAAQHGGGAFMLPYFISLLILGFPLCWAEWTMGRYAGVRGFHSAPGIYSVIWRNPLAKYFGVLAIMIPLVIYMYYVLIESWCLGYAIHYLTGDMIAGSGGKVDTLIDAARHGATEPLTDQKAAAAAFDAFFSQSTGSKQDGVPFEVKNYTWLLVLLGTFFLNFYLIYRGVVKGIERFCRVAMPIMIVLALIVLVRVLTLGSPIEGSPELSVNEGLGFMWNLKPDEIWDSGAWLAASGQIFFSISVGFGIIINYASYLRRKDDIALSGLTAGTMNEFFEVCLGGLITIPAAFIFFLGTLPPEQQKTVIDSSFQLGFVALPNVFNGMGMWGGRIFGFLWFFMLFIAAITSSVSMLQPVIAFLEEGLGLRRHASAAILGLVSALGCGFVMYFSKGLVALDTFDFWVGTVLIFILAMFQAIIYGWILGIDRGEKELHEGAHIRVPRFIQYVLKFVVPVYLLAIFALFCLDKLPSTNEVVANIDASYSAELVGDRPSATLLTALREEGVALNAEAVIETYGDNKWTVTKRTEGEPDVWLGTFQVTDEDITYAVHTAGYVENTLNNPSARLAVLFLATLTVFLLLLVYIAGRRWEAEGRFDGLEK